ncbi:MAG: sigma-54-dependent Fis family transcriptional regulator [Deltaproteobacteria bacterium]|nr:sigma-54-dependent Fis family transcriptional regulator [Deltaproteobacteria bacterium]
MSHHLPFMSEGARLHHNPFEIITQSLVMQAVLEKADRLKGHNTNVLIEGESGTGKELLARYLYEIEKNKQRPFIAINCASVPETLIESELFGHERGSFTGADKRKSGKFELAHGGDIFLDEIDSLNPRMQAKLLRVIQEKEFYRVGGNTPLKLRFRVIVATNKCLAAEVKKGNFREDLLYRLKVITFTMPPLRERTGDLAILADYFFKKHGGERRKSLSRPALKFLQAYSWPGNIRELENLIQALCILVEGAVVEIRHLTDKIIDNNNPDQTFNYDQPDHKKTTEIKRVMTLKSFVESLEVEYITKIVRMHSGNVTEAARVLGISRSTAYGKLNRANLDCQE